MKWITLLKRAQEYKNKSEQLLDMAVKEVAKEKGFSDKEVALFSANFASGVETVVTYDGGGEFGDLDLAVMAEMTKQEIIKRLDIETIAQ